ncbi:MAG: hypothetical protein QNJ00_05250 [Woeseiaceae bacterium]|nr:hypothetical protein [Woeseiaceae bacterium]
MSIIGSIRNASSFARIGQPAAAGRQSYSPVNVEQGRDLRRARIALLNFYRSLERLAEVADVNVRFKLDLPDARSASSLALDLSTTAASLVSSEETNTAPMSFTPFGPDWTDGSSALITIGGEYDGSHGSGPLSFEVRRAGTRGINDLRIRVEDPQGNRIRNINVRTNHALDRQYDLRNGLYLTLGSGNLINRDTTSINVSDTVGASVDPDKPLGGIRNDNPNLQFGGPSIVNGSFTVNGQPIGVSTTDTLNDVIGRVNQSAAGVTATYNSALDRVEFLQNQTGSVPSIDLQNDTSNFLAATKLASSVVTPGIDPENEQILQDVAVLAAVRTGNILINGRQIAIDVTNDSLDSVIDNINSSSAGVLASFDAETRQVLIEARDNQSVLTLDGNGTGLFAALQIPEGRVDPEALSRGISKQRSYRIADALGASFETLNDLFRDGSFSGRTDAASFRAPLEGALRSLFDGDNANVLGMRFDLSTAARRRGDTASIDRVALTRNLQLRGESVRSVLYDRDRDTGLIASLLQGTRQALSTINRQLGISGSVIDTFA